MLCRCSCGMDEEEMDEELRLAIALSLQEDGTAVPETEAEPEAQRREAAYEERMAALAEAQQAKAEARAAREQPRDTEPSAAAAPTEPEPEPEMQRADAIAAAVRAAGAVAVNMVARAEAPVPDAESPRVLVDNAMRHIEQRAVTHAFLRRLTDKRVTAAIKAESSAAGIAYLEGLEERSPQQERDLARRRATAGGSACLMTGRDFHRRVIKADTHELLCRYVELVGCGDAVDADGGSSVGDADAFVSWNWDSEWEALLGALGEHTHKAVAAGKAAPHYWLDIFAVNQHTALPPWKCETGMSDECPGCVAMGEDMMSLEEMTAGRTDKGFERVINAECSKELLVLLEPWFAPRPTTRVWCLYEILLAIMARKKLTVLSPPGEKHDLESALLEDLEKVQQVVGAISAEKAEATMEADRTKIFAAIQQLLPRGFLDLENMVKEELREWTYDAGEEALAAMTDLDERGTSELISHLANYFMNLGQHDRAEPLLEESLAARRRVNGSEDPKTLAAMNNLSALKYAKGDLDGAERLMEEALAGLRRTSGDEHPNTLTAMCNVGNLKRDKGDLDGAEPLMEEALAAFRRTLGDEHSSTIISIANLGMLKSMQGDLEGALALESEALAAKRRTLGDTHSQTLASINNVARTCYRKGDFVRAEALMSEAVAGCQRTMGDTHENTIGCVRMLGSIRQALAIRQALREQTRSVKLLVGEQTRSVKLLVGGLTIEAKLAYREEEVSFEYRGAAVTTAPKQAETELTNAAELATVVAVVHRGGSLFHEKAQRAASAGAVALIVINSEDEHMQPGIDGGSPIPVLLVRSRDADILASVTELTLTIEVHEQGEGTPAPQLSEGVPPEGLHRWFAEQADVEELVAWGFEREAVLKALEATGGNKELAANMILEYVPQAEAASDPEPEPQPGMDDKDEMDEELATALALSMQSDGAAEPEPEPELESTLSIVGGGSGEATGTVDLRPPS